MNPLIEPLLKLVAVLAVTCTVLTSGCDGQTSTLPGAGTWRVINYWAIWCTPCREEIPELNDLNSLGDVTVLGVNYDGKTGAELDDHQSQLAIQFQALDTDPAAALGTTRPQVLPTTLLVSPEGALMATLTGPQTREQLETALAEIGRKTST